MTPQNHGDRPSQRARRLTWGTIAGVGVCLAAGAFELSRALGGNPLSWVYAFEWPLIAGYVVYIWHKLVAEDRQGEQPIGAATPPSDSAPLPSVAPDPQLAAWQDYLARLHASDPPGGPSPRGRPE